MERISHNIEYEERLIEILECGLIGPDNSNRWLIVDENNHQVGFIQYKKLYGGNKKKGFSKVYGYHTVIKKNDLFYEKKRKINPNRKENKNNSVIYKFDIQREGSTDSVKLNVGRTPKLEIWGYNHGYTCLEINEKKLAVYFDNNTKKFLFVAKLFFQLNVKGKNIYNYQILYRDNETQKEKNYDFSCSNFDPTIINVIQSILNGEVPKKLKLNELSEYGWINEEFAADTRSAKEKVINEFVKKWKIGMDAFAYFRIFINQLFPFIKEDIILKMIEKSERHSEEESVYTLFLPELSKPSQNNARKRTIDFS